MIDPNSTPSISLGQILGLVVAVLSVTTMIVGFVVGAYKLGQMSQRITNSEERVVQALSEMRESLREWGKWRERITDKVYRGVEARHDSGDDS